VRSVNKGVVEVGVKSVVKSVNKGVVKSVVKKSGVR
jgi:hypothetical protein